MIILFVNKKNTVFIRIIWKPFSALYIFIWERDLISFWISDDSDVDDLLQKTGNYLVTSSSLPKGLIDLKQCTDANKEQPSEVRSLHKKKMFYLTNFVSFSLSERVIAVLVLRYTLINFVRLINWLPVFRFWMKCTYIYV